MTRLRQTLASARGDHRAALILYLTHGDPTPAHTADLAAAAAAAGADIIELGVPFTDPNADGVVIQRAMQRALAAGGGLHSALATVAALRDRGCQVPVVLFGYYNPIFVYGVERFAAAAATAQVDAVLTVDLPIEELAELQRPAAARGIEVVPLVAPTSGTERMARVRAINPPFVYYISMTGVTGASFAAASVGPERVGQVRAATGAPVAVGFGIKTPEDARTVATYADGVVVGSALVRTIERAGPERSVREVAALVAALREAMNGARPRAVTGSGGGALPR